MPLIEATEKDIARFMNKVKVGKDTCWHWQGAKSRGKGNKKWYGTFKVGGKAVRAHRFSSEVFNKDECPKGYHRDHLCSNSICVNPDHIEVVTHEENQRRKMESRNVQNIT